MHSSQKHIPVTALSLVVHALSTWRRSFLVQVVRFFSLDNCSKQRGFRVQAKVGE
jgi:hypothetical protein